MCMVGYLPGSGLVGHLIEERVSRTKTVGRVAATTVGTGVVIGGGGVVGQGSAVPAGHGLVEL